MTPFILVALLAEVLAVSGQASWGVSVVHDGQPQQVYYVNSDGNPYGPIIPFLFFSPPSNEVPDMAQPPPGVEINPDAEVFDPSVRPSRPGSSRGVHRRQFGAKLKRHVKGYDQPKPQERKPLPPLAPNHPEEPDYDNAAPEHPMNASYGFEYSAEGQSRREHADENGNIDGSFTFVGDDGVERRVDYKAGAEIGFVPTGAHLPVPAVPDYSGTPSVVNQNGIKGGIKPSVSSHTPATRTKTPVAPKVPQTYPEVATHTPTYGVKTPVTPIQPGIKGKSDPSEEGCDEGKSDVPMDASYDFSYTNDDSERKEKSDPNGNIEGSYWFVGDDGVRREIKYTAGAGKGFVVTGDIYPTGNAGSKGAVPRTKGYPQPPTVNIPGPSVKNVPHVPVTPQVPLPRVPSVKSPVPQPIPAYPQPTPGVKTKTPSYPSKPLPPQQPLPELPTPGTKSVPSNDCDNEEPGDASYDFSYKTDDHEHSAKSDANGNVQGSYSFTGPDGVLRRVDYIAGADTGFVATGDHLPKEGDFVAVDEGRGSNLPPQPHQTPVNPQRPLPLPPQKPIQPQIPLPLTPQQPVQPHTPLPLPPQKPVQPHTPLPLPHQKPVEPRTPLPLPPQKPVQPQTPLPLPPQIPVQPHTPLPLPPQKPVQPHTPLPLPPQKPVQPHTPLPLPPQKPVQPHTPLPLPPQKPLPPQIPEEPRTPSQEPLEPDYPQVPVAPRIPQTPLVPVYPHIPSYPQVPLVPQFPIYPQIPLVPQGPLPDYPQRPIHVPDLPSVPVDGQIPVYQPNFPPVDDNQTPVDDGQTPIELTPQQPGCDPQSRDYDDDNSPADRSYSFDFASDDHTRKEKSDSEGNVQGTYSFVGPDGIERRVEYEAGPEIGFVAKGDHLPKPVEPLPLGPSEDVPPRSHGVANREPLEPEGEFGNDPADSSYSFTYSTDSHSREAADPHGMAKGTFLFVDDDGVEKKVDYQADKLVDFPAYGMHLPEEFQKAITTSGIAPPPFFSRYIFNTDSANEGHLNEDPVFKYHPTRFSSNKGEEKIDAPTAAPLVAKSELKSSQKPSYETFNKRGKLPLKSISQSGSSKGGYSYSYNSDDDIHNEAGDNFEKFKKNFSFVNDDGLEENDGFEKNFGAGYRRLNTKKTDDKSSKTPMSAALTNDLNKATEKVSEKDEKTPTKHAPHDPFNYFPLTASDDAAHDHISPSGVTPPSPFLLPPRENFYMPNAMSFANRLYRRAQLKQRGNSHR